MQTNKRINPYYLAYYALSQAIRHVLGALGSEAVIPQRSAPRMLLSGVESYRGDCL